MHNGNGHEGNGKDRRPSQWQKAYREREKNGLMVANPGCRKRAALILAYEHLGKNEISRSEIDDVLGEIIDELGETAALCSRRRLYIIARLFISEWENVGGIHHYRMREHIARQFLNQLRDALCEKESEAWPEWDDQVHDEIISGLCLKD